MQQFLKKNASSIPTFHQAEWEYLGKKDMGYNQHIQGTMTFLLFSSNQHPGTYGVIEITDNVHGKTIDFKQYSTAKKAHQYFRGIDESLRILIQQKQEQINHQSALQLKTSRIDKKKESLRKQIAETQSTLERLQAELAQLESKSA